MSCPSETRLQAFVDGDLSPEDIATLSGHLDACDECRRVVGSVQPVSLDPDNAADHVGRYVLRRVLGEGGMGVVYEAADPELHRVVALKLLRSELSDKQKRLLEEAQAMAMLSHPNVVTIFDVGRADGRAFIVMELVRGANLRQWLASEPRILSEVLDAFEQAAEGLRAAHRAGLVHRDFKPENVFVAAEGRVLVGDFGLAVVPDESNRKGEGSLAYMAPEQRRGDDVDARSDQYSFCLALTEAITPTAVVPRWLSRVLSRGISERAEERFPTMDALLDALREGRQRVRKRKRALAGLAVATVLLAGALGWVRVRAAADTATCDTRAQDFTGVWNPEVSRQTERAFQNTQSPLARGAWDQTRAVLDAYRTAWSATHQRVCQPVPLREQASLQKSSSCLAERLEMARAVVKNLQDVDAPMLERVPAMLALLPRIEACADARQVAQLLSPPEDKRAAVEATRRQLAEAAAVTASGRYESGLQRSLAAFRDADATGYLPVLAEAYLRVGIAHGRLGHARESEQALERAVSSASAGRSPLLAIRAWIALMHFVGFEGKRYDDGFRYAEYAKSALEGVHGAYELEAERLSWTRAMLLDQKKLDEALDISQKELALVELRFGSSHARYAVALDGRAGVLVGKCRARDALGPQKRACEIIEAESGAPHPQLALCLGNLAALHAKLGEHGEALALKQRALDMFEQVAGHPNHVAMTRRNRVRSLLELGRLEEAAKELDAASALSRREPEKVRVLLLRGALRLRQGQVPQGLADHRAVVERTRDAEAARRLEPVLALAEAHLFAGKYADALAEAKASVSLATEVYGTRSCRLAEPLRVQADALLGRKRSAEALPLAERALSLFTESQGDPLARARAEVSVARALPRGGQARARQLALSAGGDVRERRGDPTLLKHIDTLLAEAP